MEEIFDIYNKLEQPLNLTKPRSVVHQNGDWHKAVHIYVVNETGQFLVHLRSPLKDLKPNTWDTRFGGHVLAGEDYESTAVKEVSEEIGLQVKISDLLIGPRGHHDGITNREHVQSYFYNFNGELSELNFNDSEVVKVKWMSPDDVITDMTNNPNEWSGKPKGFKEIWDFYKQTIS